MFRNNEAGRKEGMYLFLEMGFFFSRLILQTLIVVLIQGVNFGTLKSSKMRGSLDKLAGYKREFSLDVRSKCPAQRQIPVVFVWYTHLLFDFF